MEQDILIYIDDKEKLDASVTANSFAHKDIKNRAYINTLGAELAMKYLVSENIDVSDAKNLHSIKKILEEMDIADVMLSNIHIDVRVVFDENVIFIPKSHFEYDILPDIYLVFNLSQDRSYVKFLGFFEPKLINKNNANSEYYFIEKEKLNSAQDLVNYINSHKYDENILSQEELENSERFIVSVYDNDISESDKKELLKQLTKSAELRDKFIEFENFETLSYKAMNDPMIEKKDVNLDIQTDTIENIDTIDIVEDTPSSVDVAQTLDVLELDDDSLDLNSVPELDEFTNLDDLASENDTPQEMQENLETTDRADVSGTEFSDMVSDLAKGVTEGLAQGAVQGAIGGLAQSAVQGAAAMGLAEGITEGVTEGLVEGAIDTTKDIAKGVIDATADIVQGIGETISLEDIELPEPQAQSDETNENTISFDDIELSQPQGMAVEQPTEDLISLDNIENIKTEDLQLEDSIDLTSFDNIEPLQADGISENEISNSQEGLTNLDDIGNIENLDNNEVLDTTELSDITEPEMQDISLDDISEVEPLDVEQTENVNNESSFGKNLLENLSAESEGIDNDDEQIQNLEDLALDEDAPKLVDDIASDDLLSQIDDILNTSSAVNTPVDVDNDETQEEVLNTDTDTDTNETVEENATEQENVTNTESVEAVDAADTAEITNLEDLAELEGFENTELTNAQVVQNENSEILSDDDATDIEAYAQNDEDSDLNVLYNEEATGEQPELPEEETQTAVPGVALYSKKAIDQKSLIVASSLIVIFAVSSALLFLRPKNGDSANVEPLPAKNEMPVQADETPSDDLLASNTPQAPITTQKDIAVTKPVVKELQNTPPKIAKAEPYMEVSKLVWDVPDSLSYSSKMQNYLRTAGKSIKLSLSTDLLLATEYAYTNQIKVGLKLDKNGSVQDARILSSSGSTQIDNIVLQSVKGTLNVIKPPADEISTPDFNLNLIIYI